MALQTGTWKVDGNGHQGDLVIQNVGADGRLTGTIYGQPIKGWWDEEDRRITFLRQAASQSWDGYGWEQPIGSDVNFFLAGSFETYAGGGGSAKRPTYGWFATMHVIG
jgi:hypothetical protein